MVAIEEYLDPEGGNRYRAWFSELDVAAAVKVTTALERLAHGNKSAIKSVGQGVSEYRIDFGPGYRIYFGRDGDQLIVLLGGGSKKRQSQEYRMQGTHGSNTSNAKGRLSTLSLAGGAVRRDRGTYSRFS
jgi:putative addiction module killer protein